MSLLKPTVKTPFHIDFEWWKQNEGDWHIFLRSFLCAEHQEAFANVEEGEMIDWIDPQTAEVKPVDGVQHALISHCAQLPDFVNQRTAIVEAIFRLFLANGNIPMSAEDLSKKLGKPADTILRTIAGPRVYRGLRPMLNQPTETM
ncbi:MAG TPA: hypothetical protein PLR93_01280 [Anaerolineales bacterium]|nr:hypothetical protein [Anaerolineales bacterium]HND50472.1 hypothetical protein [Anaerolineales bacterium]HNE03701.1 hypothetical protein [Anaerolineales bacterium]HNH25616.1 hypothetical protein [Anaerolineales bacterium]HNM37901.1 hypothetical protein [Anaerolineales bacterium]